MFKLFTYLVVRQLPQIKQTRWLTILAPMLAPIWPRQAAPTLPPQVEHQAASISTASFPLNRAPQPQTIRLRINPTLSPVLTSRDWSLNSRTWTKPTLISKCWRISRLWLQLPPHRVPLRLWSLAKRAPLMYFQLVHLALHLRKKSITWQRILMEASKFIHWQLILQLT